MGRKATGPKFWASLPGFGCWHIGQKHRLHICEEDDSPSGPHFRAALAAFADLMAGPTRAPNADWRIGDVFDYWLDHLATNKRPAYGPARVYLAQLRRKTGDASVSSLRPALLVNALHRNGDWAPSTKGLILNYVRAAFTLAKDSLEIAVNPMADVKQPADWSRVSRGRDFVMKPALVSLVLAESNPALRRLLAALEVTGARPIELCKATGRNWDAARNAVIYRHADRTGYRAKGASRRKTGMLDRLIFFPPDMGAEITARARPGEALFTNNRRTPWTTATVGDALRLVRERAPVQRWCQDNQHDPERVVAYAFRHTLATRKLFAGMEPALLAAALGTSVKQLEEHYFHADSEVDTLRASFLSY